MCKAILFIIILLAISKPGICQITKENWMMGGSISYSTPTQGESLIYPSTMLRVSPTIGYFFIDKLAAGLTANYSLYFENNQGTGQSPTNQQIEAGPFIRYYFLDPEKKVNIFTQGLYQYTYGWNNSNASGSLIDLMFTGGTTVFLNSIVGIEFTANYQLEYGGLITVKTFSLGVGFQIYLIKEKK
jgi:hypothetical protein